MIIELRVKQVKKVVCNQYTIEVESKDFAEMLKSIPANILRPMVENIK